MQLFNEYKIILDLCGGTGSWSKPYKDNGYDVRIIDPQEWLDNVSGQDVRLFQVTDEPIHGILAAPPCTHFAGSGSRWWEGKGDKVLIDALSIVDACLRIIWFHKPNFWALENPVGRLKDYIGSPKCTFQPYEYGDPYSKRTCLWGDFNMPPPTDIVEPEMVEFISKKGEKKRMSKNYYDAFKLSKNERSLARSITSKGFAKAFYECNK